MFLFSPAVGASKTGRAKMCLSFLQPLEQVKRQIKNIFLFYLAVGTSKMRQIKNMFFFSPAVGASKRGRSHICFSALGASKNSRSKMCVSSLQLFEQVKRQIKNRCLFSPAVGASGRSKICFSSSNCCSKQKRHIYIYINKFLFSPVVGASKRCRSKN